jgi:CheY-like chemotaxis protein
MTLEPTILVVDDEPSVLQMLGVVLLHYGFAVKLASCGYEAVEIYRRHHESIGAVLLDVQMDGMDGPQTLAVLQRLHRGVPAVFMSADTGRYSDEDLLAMGAAHVLSKPFRSLHEVAQALSKVTGQKVGG